jgi:AraC-like DNA-binding protein
MIINLITLITSLLGFVTVGLIYKNYKLNNAMNIYIIFIIITISLRFFLMAVAHFSLEESFKSFCSIYSNFALIIIPLFYLYFKNLSNETKELKKSELFHFIFPVFFFLVLIHHNSLKIFYKNLDFFLFIIFLLYIILYTFISHKVLKQNIWLANEKGNVFKKQGILKSNWTYFLFLAIILLELRLLGSILFELSFAHIGKDYNFQWIGALIWLIILVKIIASPEILYGFDALRKKINENRNESLILNTVWNIKSKRQINNAQHQQLKQKIGPNILNYIEKIENISLQGQLFRDSTVTIADLAYKLNAPKSHVAYLFKYHSTKSFSEYKKLIRIQDAITLINNNYLADNTLDYLSKKVGFPSYNTFFTSFKEISGVSPFEYCKKEIK